MLWEDDQAEARAGDAPETVDLAFRLRGERLPVDHAQALAGALRALAPWLDDEPGAGIHAIRVPETGNGWMRPGGADAWFHLSRRTRLHLRLPATRVDAARRLSDTTLEIAGHELRLGDATARPVTPAATLFARHVLLPHAEDESRFETGVVSALCALGIRPRKVLCGLQRSIETQGTPLSVRAVMVADLAPDESRALLARGLGVEPLLGCGLFVPHKGIAAVGEANG
jgi:CRISPR-associated protein Cas6